MLQKTTPVITLLLCLFAIGPVSAQSSALGLRKSLPEIASQYGQPSHVFNLTKVTQNADYAKSPYLITAYCVHGKVVALFFHFASGAALSQADGEKLLGAPKWTADGPGFWHSGKDNASLLNTGLFVVSPDYESYVAEGISVLGSGSSQQKELFAKFKEQQNKWKLSVQQQMTNAPGAFDASPDRSEIIQGMEAAAANATGDEKTAINIVVVVMKKANPAFIAYNQSVIDEVKANILFPETLASKSEAAKRSDIVNRQIKATQTVLDFEANLESILHQEFDKSNLPKPFASNFIQGFVASAKAAYMVMRFRAEIDGDKAWAKLYTLLDANQSVWELRDKKFLISDQAVLDKYYQLADEIQAASDKAEAATKLILGPTPNEAKH